MPSWQSTSRIGCPIDNPARRSRGAISPTRPQWTRVPLDFRPRWRYVVNKACAANAAPALKYKFYFTPHFGGYTEFGIVPFCLKRTLSPDCQPRSSPLLRDQPDAANLFCTLYPALRAAAAQLFSLDVPQARCVVYGQKTLLFHRVLLPPAFSISFFRIIHALPPFIPDTAALFFRLRQFRSFLFPVFPL